MNRALPWNFPAPVRGLIENENLAANGGVGCYVMENWFPLQATVRVRGGALKRADVGSLPVLTLMPYNGPVPKIFAATAARIFDITTLDPEATPAPVVDGMGSGYWSHVQFGTGGGTFLLAANGVNSMRYFDGTGWSTLTGASTPIAVTGLATSEISHIWMHGARLWGVRKGSLSAYYLPVNQIGGALTEFSMSAVFKRGGALLFGAAWSSDSGDGMDDRCVFVTDQGEVAVYQGTDPSTFGSWSKVGVYEISRPVGTQTMHAGGDLLIATEDGIVPMSAVVSKTPTELSMAAVTRAVEPTWRRAVRTRDVTKPFTMLRAAHDNMALFGLPHRPETLVANLQTGAWTKFTGWDVQSMCLYQGLAFFGDSLGNVFQVEGAGADNGQPYVCRLSYLPDALGAPGAYKSVLQAKATFRALAPFTPDLSVSVDYGRGFPPPPSAAPDPSAPALWDVGVWDVSRWDDSPLSEERETRETYWRSMGRSGRAISPQVQVTCGGARAPDAELVSLDMTYSTGAMVV